MRAALACAFVCAACTTSERVTVPFMAGEPGTTEILSVGERVYVVELGSVFEPEEPLLPGSGLVALHYPRSPEALGLRPGPLSRTAVRGPLRLPYSAWTLSYEGTKVSAWAPATAADPRLTAFRPRLALTSLGSGSSEVHTCFLGEDRLLYCMGKSTVVLQANGAIILGRLAGLRDDAHQPTALPGIDEVSLVTTGTQHTCYARLGRVYCFGSNEHGQLGRTRSLSAEAVPVEISSVPSPSALVAFGTRSCAISGGRAFCWGLDYGSDTPVELAFPTSIEQIAVGTYTTCGLGGGHLYCQGGLGLFGLPSTCNAVTRTSTRPEPFPFPPTLARLDGRIRQIGLGDGFGCFMTTEQEVYCWGCNSRGQLGTGQSDRGNTPEERPLVETPILRRALELRVGAHTACAIDEDRALWCWGWNSFGQIGLPGGELALSGPHHLAELGAVDKVATYYHHTCAQAVSGEVWCFGRSDCGQLGTGMNGRGCDDNTGTSEPAMPWF